MNEISRRLRLLEMTSGGLVSRNDKGGRNDSGAALVFAVKGLIFDSFTRYTQGALWWGSWVALLAISIMVVRKNQKHEK